MPPSSAEDLYADDVHEVQDNQGFITYHISVTWSLSDKNDLTDICRIIFTQLPGDKIHHKKRLHKLFLRVPQTALEAGKRAAGQAHHWKSQKKV